MKQLGILTIMMLWVLGARSQEKPIHENFNTYNLNSVEFLPSTVTIGNFTYEFKYNGKPVDSSSLVTNFDNDGSIFIGQQSKVTEFLIKSVKGDEFSLNSFQLSSNHAYSNPNEKVIVRGWRNGKVVTAPVPLEVSVFEPPGDDHELSYFQGFDKVDEVRITGDDLQLTLESFTYQFGPGSVAKEINIKDKKD